MITATNGAVADFRTGKAEVSAWIANRSISVALPRVLVDAALPSATCALLVLALLLGGGAAQGFWSDAIVQLASLPLLVGGVFRLVREPPDRAARWPLILLCAALMLPLVQLVPLPPALWTVLPERGAIAQAYGAAGMALPWLPISMDPAATGRSLLSMIPAGALFLAILSLGYRARRLLVLLVLAIVSVSVLLDLLQIMGGTDSPLRFFTITNPDRAVGFFANSNHNAAFLYCAIPFTAAWAIGLVRDHRSGRTLGLILSATLLAAVVIGLAIVRSRGGLALGFVAGLSCIALAWPHGRSASRRPLLLVALGGNLLALLIAFQFGFVAMAERAEKADFVEELRWPVAVVTSQAALANLPLGTGMGSFESVYPMFAPRTLLREQYVNHAHNDWLELWLNGGLPALALALGFLVWLGASSLRLWRAPSPGVGALDVTMARAGSIVLVLLLVHSIVDYPLRTTAMMAVFALACALMIPPKRAHASTEPVVEPEQPARPRHGMVGSRKGYAVE